MSLVFICVDVCTFVIRSFTTQVLNFKVLTIYSIPLLWTFSSGTLNYRTFFA